MTHKIITRKELKEIVNEGKPERPKDIFDAVNSEVSNNYMPKLDFALIRHGCSAKRALKKMFPENIPDINHFTARQARFFYYNIRKKYG